MKDYLLDLVRDPDYFVLLKNTATLSIAIVLVCEWLIWGFLDGRLKKIGSFMRPWVALNVLMVFTGISFFNLLFNHLFVASYTAFLLTLILTVIHIVKFKMLGLPLFFWDYIVLREPLLYIPALIQKVSTYLILIAIVGVLTGSFYFVSFLPAQSIPWQPRAITFAFSFCLALLGFYLFKVPYHRFFPANSFRDSIVFKTGLLPFVALTARYSKSSPAPAGYGQEKMIEIAQRFNAAADKTKQIAADSLPNVILYGIESLMDPASFGVQYRQNPLPFFTSITNRTGKNIFVSPTFGGQTVQPEFELLTGLSQYHLSVPNPFVHIIGKYEQFPTLAQVFKNRGYHCWGIQAVSALEFQRKQYYPLIGFDRFVALESDYPKEDWQMIHHLLADEYLVKKMQDLLPLDDKPVFGLFLTNSTHVSYDSWERQESFQVIQPTLQPKSKEILERYASAIHQADQALEKIVNYFQQQPRRTLILVFGDHLPGVSSVFQDLGSFAGTQGFHRFHTPLAIWSNFELPKTERIISANLLPALLCNLLNIEAGELPIQLQLVQKLYQEVDVLSTYIRDKQGRTFDRRNPPQSIKALAQDYDLLQYDLLEGQSFSLKGKI